jgi:hypothetical protein
MALDYPPENITGLILSGFVIPVFFISLAYYRVKRNRMDKDLPPMSTTDSPPSSNEPEKEKHETH